MIGLIHKIAVFLSKQYYQKKDWKSEFYKDCKNGTLDNLLLLITELITSFDKFSEDIDIAVDREFPGYGGELSRTQVSDKLRRAACSFVREKLQFDLRDKMIEQGVPAGKFSVNVNITPVTTVDPEG